MTFKEPYKEYLAELGSHLFANASFEEILQTKKKSHRKKRYVALYLAQDNETFHHYYERRKEFGLEQIYSQLISALLFETEKSPIKREMVKELEVTKDMIDFPCFDYEINEIKKDLNSFQLYLLKRTSKIRLVRANRKG